jgi:class 3 adenylate cyclase/CHASE2 domain-containing sensor protein
MRKPKRAEIVATLLIALAAGLSAACPLGPLLRGWTIDAETTLRWWIFGDRRRPDASSTVVIALDEETYRTPPFKGSPTLTWTGDIGRVVGAALDAGAKVVGFDIVFASSIEDSAIRYADGALGASLRGFDRDYLRVLATAAREGRIVLGEIATPDGLVRPSAGQRFAVGGDANIRALNVETDADDVVRRVPVAFKTEAGYVPSLSLELAARSLGEKPGLDGVGATLAGWRVPIDEAKSIAVAFSGGAEEAPSYSLADLRSCLEKPDKDYLRRQFAGKVVLIGQNIATEDQIRTARRFLPSAQIGASARCALPQPLSQSRSGAISGVFLQAAAVENLIHREALVEPTQAANLTLAIAAAALAGLAGATLSGAGAAGAAIAILAAWLALVLVAFQGLTVLPLFEPLAAALMAAIGATLVRIVGVDREQRFLQRVFGLYLAPAMVERISASGILPRLGGETREVTLFFSDVVGFSTLSESMTPQAIVSLMNAYLSEMSEEIERAGGFVDKFVGDAIVAIFGAPLASSHHPAEAVEAAVACRERLRRFNQGREIQLQHRIGLNGGEALVGNVGSRNRFNYSALGDAVNLAARLEHANASLGTSILASQYLVARTSDRFFWREIATIRVRGRSTPVTVFEPMARRNEETEAQRRHAQAYAEGLSAWRKRDFAGAERCFARHPEDRPAAMFRQRCRLALAAPADSNCAVFEIPLE